MFPAAGSDQCDDPSTLASVETCTGYELTADIDLGVDPWNAGSGWTPIGGYEGVFDGKNHTISNLFMNQDSTNATGLFANKLKGTIRNLALVDVDITAAALVGAVVGALDVDLVNVFASGTVTSTADEIDSTGGLVGAVQFTGAVRGSLSAVDVVAEGVSGQGSLGGLAGVVTGEVSDSYAVGSVAVLGTGALQIAGLSGSVASTARITNSYSLGAVSVPSDATNVGGLIGVGAATGSYWDTFTSGQDSSAGGTGLGTSALQSPTAAGANAGDTYHGWAAATWDFGTSSQYPALKGLTQMVTLAEQRALLNGVALSVSPTSFSEDGGLVSFTYTARLLGPTRTTATFVGTGLEGTATGSGTDYTGASPNLTIQAGDRTASSDPVLTPNNDSLAEGTETIVVIGRDFRTAPWCPR